MINHDNYQLCSRLQRVEEQVEKQERNTKLLFWYMSGIAARAQRRADEQGRVTTFQILQMGFSSQCSPGKDQRHKT